MVITNLMNRLQQEEKRQGSPIDRPGADEEGLVAKVSIVTRDFSLLSLFFVSGSQCGSAHLVLQVTSQARLIENLQRESRLMASAYHDLAGRLQVNSIVLQRRDEAPRSWLNKQRKLVDQPALATGRS